MSFNNEQARNLGRYATDDDEAALEADPHQWPASARDALNEWANRR